MANNVNADEVVLSRHIRNFIQFGGPRPNNPVAYAGQDAQYMMIGGVSSPEIGGVDPQWVHDPRRQGLYRLVARSITPADLPGATITMREKHGSIPRQLQRIGCAFNAYDLVGQCKDLSDFISGWSDYVLVYSYGLVTDKDLGDRTAFDADDPIADALTIVLSEIYPVGSLNFGEQAATQIDREVVDVVYGSNVQCGNCGPEDDGSGRLYAVTKSSGGGSPGLPAEVIAIVNNVTYQYPIAGIGASEDPVAIAVVGQRLVVVAPTAIYWADIDFDTGLPGAFTKVTAGIEASADLTDVYVAGPREVYFSALTGYIYKSTDITTGVTALNAAATTSTDLYRVDGHDDTLAACGTNGMIIISQNRGRTFTVAASSPVAANSLRAIGVLDKKRLWVGTFDTGRVFYSLNGAKSWAELTFSGSGSGAVRDILWVNDEVGYIAHNTTAPVGRILATWNGGKDWGLLSEPRIVGFPTIDYAGRLAAPQTDSGVAANNLAVAGLAGNGLDGVLLLGIAGRT